MAPVATAPTPVISNQPIKPVYPKEDANFKLPPANTLKRYEKAGVDISRTFGFYSLFSRFIHHSSL